MVMGYQEPEKKEKTAAKMSLFYSDNSKESPYLKDGDTGEKATWLDVDHAVMEVMTAKGITWESLAECQRKVPLLIFKLLDEVDELQSQLVATAQKKEPAKK